MKGWLRHGVLAALLFGWGVLGLSTARSSTAGVPSAAAAPDRYLVLIVIDGFRPDYLSLARMRHLHTLMASGMTYTRAWVGQLEAQTPTGHATLATGAYPRKHGVIGFVWRTPAGDNITWMPTVRNMINAGDMERLIEAGGVPSISDMAHRAFPGSKSVSLSGEKFYAADAMGVGADYIVYADSVGKNRDKLVPTAIGRHFPPQSTHYRSLARTWNGDQGVQDTMVADMAVRMVSTVRPRLLLVNFPATDIEGHLSGGVTDRGAMREVITNVDRRIGQIVQAYKRAGLYDRTVFVVTADHGMVPNGQIVPRQAMYDAVRKTGTLWLEEDLLSSAGYEFLRDPRDTSRVAGLLAQDHFAGVEGVLYKVQAPSGPQFVADPSTAGRLGPAVTRAYLDLSNTLAAPNGPDIILPYREDAVGLTPKGEGPRWGTHGGLSWRVQHIPLFISGPGVRRGSSSFPAQLVDVAPTVERLMGMSVPQGVDGVVLADALRRQNGADVSAQRAVAPRRSRDVDALKGHSLAQHGLALSGQ